MKQESLEKAADKTLQDEINYWYEKTGSLTSEDIVRRAYSLGITTGAKWQSERMYSEEDMLDFANYCRIQDNKYPNTVFMIQQHFEKFKKSKNE